MARPVGVEIGYRRHRVRRGRAAADEPDEPPFDPAAPSAQIINERGGVAADGINAVYLEREGKAKTGYTWHHVTHWFSPEEAALLTHVSLVLMDALWAVAIEKLTHGHVLQLNFSNSFNTTPGQIARGGTPNVTYMGFNLSRKF